MKGRAFRKRNDSDESDNEQNNTTTVVKKVKKQANVQFTTSKPSQSLSFNDDEETTTFKVKKSKLSKKYIESNTQPIQSIQEETLGGRYNLESLNELKSTQQFILPLKSDTTTTTHEETDLITNYKVNKDIEPIVLSGTDAEKLEEVEELEYKDRIDIQQQAYTQAYTPLLHTTNTAEEEENNEELFIKMEKDMKYAKLQSQVKNKKKIQDKGRIFIGSDSGTAKKGSEFLPFDSSIHGSTNDEVDDEWEREIMSRGVSSNIQVNNNTAATTAATATHTRTSHIGSIGTTTPKHFNININQDNTITIEQIKKSILYAKDHLGGSVIDLEQRIFKLEQELQHSETDLKRLNNKVTQGIPLVEYIEELKMYLAEVSIYCTSKCMYNGREHHCINICVILWYMMLIKLYGIV